MKIVQINSVCGKGSTGKICVAISELLIQKEIENYIFYVSKSSNYPLGINYMSGVNMKLQALKSRILGNYGYNSRFATLKLLKELDSISPDIVHLHNLHSHNVNLEMLSSYLKEKRIKVFWTFHDCWAFTAYCPHFVMAKCDKWKVGCHHCIQRKTFSWFFDRSAWVYEKKKKCFEGLDLTIVTPSKWLADLVKESFFKDYPVKVIHNGIDLNVFCCRNSDFRERYGIAKDQFMILGVADKWVPRKGPDVFIELAKRLDDKFKIVLVGTDDIVDKQLPSNIISVHRTTNQVELAEIYTAADLFVNPTREEVFGLVNVEANACGTPALMYRTGGSPECIDKKSGSVVECDDVEALYQEIIRIYQTKPFNKTDCILNAKRFQERIKYEEYVSLYFEKYKA